MSLTNTPRDSAAGLVGGQGRRCVLEIYEFGRLAICRYEDDERCSASCLFGMRFSVDLGN